MTLPTLHGRPRSTTWLLHSRSPNCRIGGLVKPPSMYTPSHMEVERTPGIPPRCSMGLPGRTAAPLTPQTTTPGLIGSPMAVPCSGFWTCWRLDQRPNLVADHPMGASPPFGPRGRPRRWSCRRCPCYARGTWVPQEEGRKGGREELRPGAARHACSDDARCDRTGGPPSWTSGSFSEVSGVYSQKHDTFPGTGVVIYTSFCTWMGHEIT